MKYNIPLVFKPFANSESFVCHHNEKRFDPRCHGHQVVNVRHERQLRFLLPNTLYVTNYCNTILDEMELDGRYIAMLNELKRNLQPIDLIINQSKADGELCVAVHIRKGSAEDSALMSEQYFDNPSFSYSIFSETDFFDHLAIVHGKRGGLQLKKKNSDAHYPGKFPPEQYYVDQLKKLEMLYPDYHLKVYICTDSLDQEALIERIKKASNLKNAEFLRNDNKSEFEDFLILLNADCLIRSSSNFSWFAELIGKHKAVVFPRYFSWQANKLLVNDVGIKFR